MIPGEEELRRELRMRIKTEKLNFEVLNPFKIVGCSGRSFRGGRGILCRGSATEEALCLSRVPLSTVSLMVHLGSRIFLPA